MFKPGDEFIGTYPDEAADWCNHNDCWIVTYEDGGEKRFVIEPFPREAETPEQVQARYTALAQDALDAFARTRGYDGIMSACSYYGSTDAQFSAEADCCIDLRDRTWRTCYSLLEEVQAGRPLPTEEEFLAMLPTANAAWPED